MAFDRDVETARTMYDALNRGDIDAMLEHVDPRVEFCVDASIPGAVQTYRGHEGVRSYLDELREVVDGVKIDPMDFTDAGDGRMIIAAMAYGRGRSSGIETENLGYDVLTFRDAKLVRREHYAVQDDALESLGLGEAGSRPRPTR